MNPLAIIIASFSGSNPASFGTFPQQGNSFLFFLVFIVIIISLRLYRGVAGRVYSNVRVLRLPVVYMILTLVTVLGIGFIDNVILLTLALVPVGFLFGYRFGSNVNFFTRNGAVYYKRSPMIMIVWLVSYVGRMGLEFLFPLNLQVIIVVDAALSLTTGLIIGEALNITTERKKYVPQVSEAEVEADKFRINQ